MQHLPCLTGFMTWNVLARQHYDNTPRRWEISLTQSHSAELVCLSIFCDLFNYLHCDANICGDRLLTEIQTLFYKPLRCTVLLCLYAACDNDIRHSTRLPCRYLLPYSPRGSTRREVGPLWCIWDPWTQKWFSIVDPWSLALRKKWKKCNRQKVSG